MLIARALHLKKQPMLIRAARAEQLLLDALGVLGNIAAEVDRMKEDEHGE